MKKYLSMMSLSVALLAAVITSGMLLYSHLTAPPLQCVGTAEWHVGKNRFVGTLSFRMSEGKGMAVMTGKLFGQQVSEVNRSIYFHYSQQLRSRVLSNDRIVKTFADTADETDINDTLPGFYRTPERSLSLMIEEYEGAYLFSTSNVPSLYCRKT